MIDDYKEFLHNKRVIFVGPAANLMGKIRGGFIDDFDVVVRSNGAILLLNNPNYCRDYGSRVDILYCNVQFNREVPFAVQEWKKRFGLKYLCMKTCPSAKMVKYQEHVKVRVLLPLIRKIQNKVRGILMGPIILTDLSDCRPKELYFTGMDFFITKPISFIPGDYREYYPNYLGSIIEKKANRINVEKLDMHEQYSNAIYIYNIVKKGLMKTDPEIMDIMENIIDHPEKFTIEGKYKGLLKRRKK